MDNTSQNGKKFTKKKIFIISAICLICLSAVTLGVMKCCGICIHHWVPATCTEPEYCTKCEETRERATGHKWLEPTCTEGGYCENCGIDGQKALGHNIPESAVISRTESTFTETGRIVGVCSRCGEQVAKEIPIKVNVVKNTFDIASNLHTSDLVYTEKAIEAGSINFTAGIWSYKGLPITNERDCEWIDSALNTEKTVLDGMPYRLIAYHIRIMDMSSTWKKTCEIAYGFTPKSKEEMKPYVDKTIGFIVGDVFSYEAPESFSAIMHALQNSGYAFGQFNYDDGIKGGYDVTITELDKCAESLSITEEMFGYVLADLLESDPDITFDGNSCHIVLEAQKPIVFN